MFGGTLNLAQSTNQTYSLFVEKIDIGMDG